MATDQFDNFQLNPNEIGSDWKFEGQQVAGNRSPNSKMSNPQYHFVGERYNADRTRVVMDFQREENPEREIGDGFGGHGIDWSLFNYNPYGKLAGENPNFRVMNDWLQITGLGDIDIETADVMDKDVVAAEGMIQYRNYPTEGYNSFGKKGDKRWTWQGNSWVPSA